MTLADGVALSPSGAADDEVRRLETLHGLNLLDTEAEAEFDDLTRLAAQLCGTPMSTVSFVDVDRQWFKSKVGVAGCEDPREVSFCARAIQQTDPLIVPDTHVDDRFRANPLVTGDPFIRFYAGVPLVLDGFALGTLCVMDTEARTLSDRQVEQLQTLARQVVSLLHLRRDREDLTRQFVARAEAEAALRRQQSLTDDLLNHTDIAIWVQDRQGRFLLANDATRARFAPSVDTLVGRTCNDLPFYVAGGPLDRPWTGGADDEAVDDVPAPDGTLRRVSTTTFPLRDEDGSVYAVGSICADITDHERVEQAVRRSERRFRTLFDQSPVGLAECDSDGTIVDVNDELGRLLGYTRDELLGAAAADLLADPTAADQQRADIAGVGDGGSYSVRRDYRHRDGRVVPTQVSASGVRDESDRLTRLLVTVTDITARVAAEQELSAAHEELHRRQIFTDAVLDSVDVGIVACDANGELTVFNRISQTWHGMGLDDDTDTDTDTDTDVGLASRFDLYDEDGSALREDRIPLLRALREGSVTNAEIVISPHHLPATRVQCTGRALVDPDGQLLGAVVAMSDITRARAQQAALQASETRFRATFDNDPAGLAVLSAGGVVMQANHAFAKLFGRSSPTQCERVEIGELTRDGVADVINGAARRRGRPFTAERELFTRDGHSMWCLLTAIDLPDPQMGRCILLQVEDVTVRRETEQRLTRQATSDSLTGLPNRFMLLDRIGTAVARLERHESTQLFALFCDLDGFKAINDVYGHEAGDHLLVQVAQRLCATVRPADTVARLGGDEFVVLCEQLGGRDDADAVARRIGSAVAQPVSWNGHALSVRASIGIARALTTTTPQDLLRRADAAMYEAKRARRGADA